MKVLSMFDGVGCAALSLKQPPQEYVGFEIDKRLHEVTRSVMPHMTAHGDVLGMCASYKMPGRFDMVVAGSPCQGFSRLGKGKGLEDERSKLYFEFEKVLKTVRPRWWMLENVVMSRDNVDFISERLGTEPVRICAGDICAQRRPRLYWTNIPLAPLQRVTPRDARYAIDWKNQTPSSDGWHRWFDRNKGKWLAKQYIRIVSKDTPVVAITMLARQVASWNGLIVALDCGKYRFATPEELEVLNGMPKGYTAALPRMKRYAALGNSWNVHVTKQLLANAT